MNIAVYCGSDFGKDSTFREGAERLGKWMAEKGHSLVYGGGEAGIMGVISKTCYEGGCYVYGVVPQDVDFINGRPQNYVSELIIKKNMSARKQKMLEIADVFIALPGGTGTLDEISEVITLTKIGVFAKPCILFDQNGFYAPLKEMFDSMEEKGFIEPGTMRHVLFSEDLDEIERFIHNWNR